MVALARISTLSLPNRVTLVGHLSLDPVFLPQTCVNGQTGLEKSFLRGANAALLSKMSECTDENWGLLTTTATRDKCEATLGAGKGNAVTFTLACPAAICL